MDREQRRQMLNSILEKALEDVNQYCTSIKSEVTFTGHCDYPDTLYIYPCVYVSDPLEISVNIGTMRKGRKEISEILAKNGITGSFGRDGNGSIEFEGTIQLGSEVSNG